MIYWEDEMDWGDEIDWLTGEYTNKKERLLREAYRPGNRDDIMEV